MDVESDPDDPTVAWCPPIPDATVEKITATEIRTLGSLATKDKVPTIKERASQGHLPGLYDDLPFSLVLANCTVYRLFHCLCRYQDRATEH